MRRARHAQHDLLADHLDGASEVHLLLRQRRSQRAGRPAEELSERLAGHGQTTEIIEVLLIQPERSVLAQVDEITQNEIHVARLPVRSKAHHLVFTGIHLEAGVIGEGRVQQAKRIWPSELRENFQIAPPAQADRCGSPFTASVHRRVGGFLKRRWKERARCVGLVMLRIEKRPFVPAKRFTKQAIGEKLLLYPERAGLEKGSKAPRRDR